MPLWSNYANPLNTHLEKKEKYEKRNWYFPERQISVEAPSRLKPASASDDVDAIRKTYHELGYIRKEDEESSLLIVH